MPNLVRFSNARVIADFSETTDWSKSEAASQDTELFAFDGELITQERFTELAKEFAPEQVDLGGGWVIPGFRDAHCHPLFAGREAAGLHLDSCVTTGDVASSLREYRNSNSGLTWIDGAVYERSMLAGKELLAASLLDQVVSDIPVVLHADDHHTLWVNTAALRAAGLAMPERVAELNASFGHGSIDVDETGQATGILREWEAMSLVLDIAPKPTLDEDVAFLQWAQLQMVANGLVAATDAWIDPGMTEVYLAALDRELLWMRFELGFRFAPENWREYRDYALQMRSEVESRASSLLSAGTAKFFVDGVFGSATAAVHEDYHQPSHSGEYRGNLVWNQDELIEALSWAAEHGFALHLHAIGDAGVTAAIDALIAVGSPRRSVIAHTELVRSGDFERMAKHGMIANFEPYWAQQNAMLQSCVPRLGLERVDRMYEMRQAIDAGVAITFGSDWPVSSFVPLEGLQVAVTRAPLSHPEASWVLNNAPTLQEALTAYTSAAALQMGDTNRGTLKVGQKADFAVLSVNPLDVPQTELTQINVMATAVDGHLRFSI